MGTESENIINQLTAFAGIAVLVVFVLVIVGLANFVDALRKLYEFGRDLIAHFRGKRMSDASPTLTEIAGRLDQIGAGLDSEKNMRAVKYLSESGFGNQHYKSFLLWAFPNLEKAIVAAFKSSSFDNLCKQNRITIDIIDDSKDRELYLEVTGDISKVDSLWNGSSYFFGKHQPTFGAYYKERKIAINNTALKDFRKLHELFLGYINEKLPPDAIHKEISPDGMVPPNY